MPLEIVEHWQDFFLGEAGAAAALLGLLVVAITINLDRLLEFPWLPGRAAETIGIMLNTLIIVSLGLIPMGSTTMYGICVLVIGGLAWLLILVGQLRSERSPREGVHQNLTTRIVMTQIATLPFVIAGVLILVGHGGVYWIAVGTFTSFSIALANAWVLMVEIRR